jgi:hypothetical protein
VSVAISLLSQSTFLKSSIAQTTVGNPLTQIFPNYGIPAGFTGSKAQTTSPTAVISKGFNNVPNGVSDIATGGLFVEAGPNKDCKYGCNTIYPYTSRRDINGKVDQVTDTRYPLKSSTYYTYQVKFSSGTTWEPTWCDSSGCRYFVDFSTNPQGTVVKWNQGTGRTLKYVVSGLESYPLFNPVGTVTSTGNQYFSGTVTQGWIYDSPYTLYTSKYEATLKQNSKITPCSGVSYCWTMQYPLSAVSIPNTEKVSRFSYGKLLIASGSDLNIAQGNNVSPTSFEPHSLLGSSSGDLEKYAEDYVMSTGAVLSGKPKTIVARFLTQRGQLSAIGLDDLDSGLPSSETSKPISVVAIVKGDFDEAGLVSGGDRRVKYVILFFNPETGFVTRTTSGSYAKSIRKALKQTDAELPDDDKKPEEQEKLRKGTPADPNATPAECNCK